MAAWILAIPRIKPTAIAVHTGLGEHIRVEYAIKEWEVRRVPLLLLLGTNPHERTYEALTFERLCKGPFWVDPSARGNVVTQVTAAHSKEQAVWLVDEVRERGIRSVELHAPAYHMPRAYLTVLAAMDSANPFLLTPHVTPYPPGYVIPETGVRAVDMTDGEYQRIEKYQQSGDVASRKKLIDYLDWLWQTPELLYAD
jgi:hypothetical protein